MSELRATVTVDHNHNITGIAPADVPPGVHEVTITVATTLTRKRFRIEDLPRHEGPWDDRISLRREDMYGDDGR